MVSHCANPICSIPLRYLREGRLYQFEVKPVQSSYPSPSVHKKQARRVWHYWLCGQCASSMTLAFDQMEGLKVVPLQGNYPVRVPTESRVAHRHELAS
jgi:hypothetical protein